MQPLAEPLTDTELDRLETFLYHLNPEEAMSLEEMDGFFCALICSPDLVPPSEYLPLVWGGEPPFNDIEEAREIFTLVTRHWNTIAATLLRGNAYPVLVGDYEDGTTTGQEWALGFLQGISLRKSPWERLLKHKQLGAALVPVMMLAEDEEHRISPAPATQEERDAMIDVLAHTVLAIYLYFRTEEKSQRSGKKRTSAKKRTGAKK